MSAAEVKEIFARNKKKPAIVDFMIRYINGC